LIPTRGTRAAAAALLLGAAVSACAALPTAALTIGFEAIVKATELDTAVIQNLCARGVVPPTMKGCAVAPAAAQPAAKP